MNEKILVIDDNDDLLFSIVDYLEDLEFNVNYAHNGEEGIKQFDIDNPDLTITDLRMPKVDGLEVLSHIKEKNEDNPVIVVSGTGNIQDTAQALRLGANDYIIKPIIDMAILKHSVIKALETANLQKENREYQINLEKMVIERTSKLDMANIELKRLNKRLQDVLKSSTNLTVFNQCEDFANALLKEFAKDLDATGGSVYIAQENGFRLLGTLDANHPADFISFPLVKNSVIFKAVSEKKPVLIKDISKYPNVKNSGWKGYSSNSAICFPLIGQDDKVVGVIFLHDKRKPPFEEQDVKLGKILASFSNEKLRSIRANQSLIKSKERFQNLADLLPQTIFEADNDFNLVYTNKFGMNLFGYDQGVLKQKINVLNFLVPEQRETAMENLHKRIAHHINGPIEYTALKKNGERFAVLLHVAPIIDRDKLQGYRGLVVDISKQKQEIRQREKLQEQLQQAQKMEAIGNLAGGIAHDLNNMLTPIIGYSDILKYKISKDSEFRSSLDKITYASEKAKELIQQLLIFSRKKSEKVEIIDINKVVKDTINLLKSSLPSSIKLSMNLSEEKFLVSIKSYQVNQIVMNLCINASHAMEDEKGLVSKGKLDIELNSVNASEVRELYPKSEIVSEGYAMLSIKDNGKGIPDKIKKHIFEPYFTTKEEGKGTGMGLSVVHGIINSYNGFIDVDSEIDKGTTFKIYLPMALSHSIDKNKNNYQNKKGDESIIIIDDRNYVTEMLKEMLSVNGYLVETENDSLQALQKILENPQKYDLIITDLTMPNLNGVELAKKLKESKIKKPIILFTGYSYSLSNDELVDVGIVKILNKPIVFEEMNKAIREILD